MIVGYSVTKINKFNTSVGELINNGWQPFGSPSLNSQDIPNFIQAFVKYEE